jgi:hypothetical protein
VSERLRLADLLGGLSIAADLGFGIPPEEAMRSCLIATALARRQGLAEEEVADTFYTALLVHGGAGLSRTRPPRSSATSASSWPRLRGPTSPTPPTSPARSCPR